MNLAQKHIQYRYPLSIAKLCNTRIPSRSMSISICLHHRCRCWSEILHLTHPRATCLPHLGLLQTSYQLPRWYEHDGLNTNGSPCKNIPYFISKWVKSSGGYKSYAPSERCIAPSCARWWCRVCPSSLSFSLSHFQWNMIKKVRFVHGYNILLQR